MAHALQPLPRVMEERVPHTAKPSCWCQLQSTQLCTMQGQRSFVLCKVHRSGAQLHFQIRQQRNTSVQRKDSGLFPHYQRGATSSSDFRLKRNGHFFNEQDGTNSSNFTVYLKNVQHCSKNARGYILQSAHTGALVLFLQFSIYNGH